MNKDLTLSLSGDAFSALRIDFDQVLRSTIAGMIDTDQDVAEIGIKVKITLTDDAAPDFTVAGGKQTREITKPKFEHTITAVIQRKEKKTGVFAGEYELVWDRESCRYVARPIDNGQQTLFDDETDQAGFPLNDADSLHCLLSNAEKDESHGKATAREGDEDTAPGDAGEFEEQEKDPAYDVSKPFGWLRQFIGSAMHVDEAMGSYTVRTSENKVVLSSATSPENPFYCSAEKLAPHVGHSVVCVGYGADEIVNISIECEDCNEVLYDLDAPTGGLLYDDNAEDGSEVETESQDEGESVTDDAADHDADSYDYEPPEE
jgi:hypothetical protein